MLKPIPLPTQSLQNAMPVTTNIEVATPVPVVNTQAELTLWREITQNIRQLSDLPIIFDTAVQKIHEFMASDRVGIFKFQADLNFEQGEFVAEAVSEGFLAISGLKIQIPCFSDNLAWYYQRGAISAVEDIYTAGLLPSETQLLAKFSIRAYIFVPLLNGPILWGVMCIQQCTEPRSWTQAEIVTIEQIAAQIGVAIQQATLYEKIQAELEIRWQAEAAIATQLRQQHAMGVIAQQIRNSLELAEILVTATTEVKEIMQVDRVTIVRILDGKILILEEAVAPEYPRVRGMCRDDQYQQGWLEFYLQGQPRIVDDVMQDLMSLPWRADLQMAQVKSKIVAPILLPFNHGATHPGEVNDHDRLWGLLIVDACLTQRNWKPDEAKLLQQVADQLAIAIHQSNLFTQLQAELTDRQQAEAQLRERNQALDQSNQELARATRLKDEFLASMSHELRTPLNAILGMSEALQAASFGSINDRQQNSIATIEKSGKHLLALINDILDLSKIEANKFDLELTDVTIKSLCQNSLLFIKELAHKKQIRVKTQLPEYLQQLNINVDDLRFRQVLINLLSNAVKFTPVGGTVALDVRVLNRSVSQQVDMSTGVLMKSSQCIAFSIIDTGIGIAPENIGKLFQSFVQINSSLNRQYAGTGLGLALVKKIVNLHGGTVSVESKIDQGSRFTVCLPFEPNAEVVVSQTSLPPVDLQPIDPAEPPLVSPKALILIVEDNDANLETMTSYLASRGYRLAEARDGHQAIEVISAAVTDPDTFNCPDLILMDIQMPGMDGFEATRQIRQIPACATIPIIALTALAMPTDQQKCLDAGANQYVTKPVKLGQLVATIENLLKQN